MNPAPGEVWSADLGLAAKFRPVVIVSRQDVDPPRALVIYVPITSQNRSSQYEVMLPKLRFLDEGSVANVQGIGSVPRVRLGRKLGRLPWNEYQIRAGKTQRISWDYKKPSANQSPKYYVRYAGQEFRVLPLATPNEDIGSLYYFSADVSGSGARILLCKQQPRRRQW